MTGTRRGRLAIASLLLIAAQVYVPSPAIGQQSVGAEQTPIQVLGGDETAVTRLDNGAIEQRVAAFVFSSHLGAMPLRRVDVYGAADVSAYYTRRGGANGDPWLTVYVYPAAIPLDEEARNVETALTERMKVRAAAAPFANVVGARDGIQRWFDGEIEGTRMKTGFVLVLRGGWFIKARLTVPANGAPDAAAISEAALAEIPWAWMPPSAKFAIGATSTGQ